jgi:hypothetical protein
MLASQGDCFNMRDFRVVETGALWTRQLLLRPIYTQ